MGNRGGVCLVVLQQLVGPAHVRGTLIDVRLLLCVRVCVCVCVVFGVAGTKSISAVL